MSDIYGAEDPFVEDPDDPLEMFANQQAATNRTVFDAFDADPKQAARARQLSQVTGEEPSTVYGNMEEYERQYRIALTGDLMKNNPHLRDYANANPLNAKISNDDWGTLDSLSQRLIEFKNGKLSIAKAAAEGFQAGWDSPTANMEFDKLAVALENNPFFKNDFIRMGVLAGGSVLATTFRAFTGLVYGTANVGAKLWEQSGIQNKLPEQDMFGNSMKSYMTPQALARDIIVAANVAMSGQAGLHGIVNPEIMAQIRQFGERTEPWFSKGKEPPIGVHELVDKLKAQELEADLLKLKEMLDDAQESTTRELSPQAIADLVRQHPDPEGTIGIASEAIAELYGDKTPSIGDGLLGWMPDLIDQMKLVLHYGGDVQIPLADWLAHVDPAVAKQLEPATRPRVDGFNQVEVAFLSEWEKVVKQAKAIDVYHGSPHVFDAWSMEKARTGEGAASYGEGAYFAENQAVGQEYANASRRGSSRIQHLEDLILEMHNGDRQAAINELNAEHLNITSRDHSSRADQLRLVDIEELVENIQNPKGGNLYRARIKADKEQFLDWDKPLRDQTPETQAKIRKAVGEARWNEIVDFTGEQLVREYTKTYGGKNTSENLRNAGIPGIKYLDQGSRVARTKAEIHKELELLQRQHDEVVADPAKAERLNGMSAGEVTNRLRQVASSLRNELKTAPEARSHNFVVFDESLIEITHRNDQVIQSVADAAGLKSPVDEAPTGHRLVREGGDLTPDQLNGNNGIPYSILDAEGKPVGDVMIGLEGKNIHIDDIQAHEGAQAIGFSGMRDLLRQLHEQFPEAETYSGVRVSGARPDAETVKFKFSQVEGVEQAGKVASERGWEFDIAGTTGRFVPTRAMTRAERQLTAKMNRLIEQLGGEGRIRVKYADDLKAEEGKTTHGTIFTFDHNTPLIILALDPKMLPNTARHEVVHFLREYGIIKPEEWAVLEQAAKDGNWVEKHGIWKHYEGLEHAGVLEEAIAFEFGQWGASRAKAVELGSKYAKTFEKIAEFFKGIRDMLTEIFGHTPEVSELFEKIESGEIGRREGDVSRTTGKPARRDSAQLELPQGGTTNMADRTPFSGKDRMGLTARQYDLFTKRVDEIRQGRADATAEKVLKETRKRQTETWRENKSELRKTVATEVRGRPELAADSMFRDGVLDGDGLLSKPKLDVTQLTAEEQAALPKDYYAKRNAINADDAASLAGYGSGREMIDALVKFNQELKNSGMRKEPFIERLIDVETDRQMEAKYGKLDENIIRDAMDQVFSESQINLLAEQTVLLAEKAGLELTLPNPALLEQIKSDFGEQKLTGVKSEAYLRASGKLGREVETYELGLQWDKAFKAQQEQYYAAVLAKEALQIEKEVEAHGKVVDRQSHREVKGQNQEFTNWIHDLLQQSGEYTRRGEADIRHSLDMDGYKSLDDFVTSKQADGWELDVPSGIRLNGAKPIEQMTVQEFREYRDAIKTLQHTGRAVEKLEIQGRAVDFAEWKKDVIENIKTLSPRAKEKQLKGIMHGLYDWDATFVRMEEVFKDLDLRRELGPLYKALIEPMMSAKHKEYLMQEALSKRLSEMDSGNKAWRKTLKDSVPNDFFKDPNGELFDLTREHMINIMLNFGNKSNIKKFTEGWVGKEEAKTLEGQLWKLFDEHATPEDWRFVKDMGKIFEGWRKEADVVYHNLSGLPPKWLDLEPDGWYFPIIHDRYWSHQSGRKGDPFDPGYMSSTTANHYTIERTQGSNRVEFQSTIEQVAGRMQQMMHDIAYRAAVMQAHKIVSDKQIRAAIRTHYGMEYEAQLDPWIKDIANHFNQPEEALGNVHRYMHKVRMNLMVHALGASIKLMLSPDVGLLNPAAIGRFLWHRDANVKLAWEHSQEIPHTFRNMDRDYREKLEGLIKERGWAGVQAEAARFAFWPIVKVSQMFRLVTFVDKFREGQKKGWTDAQAASFADSAVRTRHGATGIPDLPAIMRDDEAMKLATTFYSYQNAMYNWQRQIPGNLKRGEWGEAIANVYGSVIISSLFGAALFNEYKKDDSWFKILAKATPIQLMSTIPFVREVSGMLVEGHPARTPWASLVAAAGSAITDGIKYSQNKRVEKPITHAANVIGLFSGLPLAQIGRTSQFLYDVETGRQKPKDVMQYVRGIIYGEAVKKR